jgi:PhnB protein
MADDLGQRLDEAIDSLLAAAGPAATENAAADLAPLVSVADMLRRLPSADFKTRLKAQLQRSVTMTAGVQTRAALRTVSPIIIHARAPELVEFLKRTLEAEELHRDTSAAAYGFYSELRIGNTVLMIGGGTAAEHGDLPGAFHAYVADCDAAYGRALAAGATTLAGATGEPADRPYGERSAFVRDTFGNHWYIGTRLTPGGVADPISQESGSVLPFLHPSAGLKYLAFLQEAFGAEQTALIEHGGRVAHAAVRIGDAVLEMGEPENRAGIPSGGLFLRVQDVDAAYERALAAGATTVRAPEDIPYGYRSALVRDPEGYLWWTARSLER